MNKKALVIGCAGKSGIAAVNFLLDQGYDVIANDNKKEEDVGTIIDSIRNKGRVTFIFGHHDLSSSLNDIEQIIISPGVPSDIAIIKEAKEKSIKVISEVELAFEDHPKNWIGITGTDGKSTTTSLIGSIMKLKYPDTIIGGNLGTPLTELIPGAGEETYVVCELSSFQLENVIIFNPLIGVLINISEDHLDRYDSMDDYIRAKFNIFKNQTQSEFSVFNSDNSTISQWLDKIKIESKKCCFSMTEQPYRGTYFKNDHFRWKFQDSDEEIFHDGDQVIQGEHNKENILAAICVAKILKIENEYIQEGIRQFKGLPHRMELARSLNGRTFFNDSKATTPSAVKKSIAGFDNVVLIMGGRDKGVNYSILNEELNRNVKKLVLIGEAKEKIRSMISYPRENIIELDNLEQGVRKSYEVSENGDNIILSPGCTSYDQFENFEERGDFFKSIVQEIS